MRTIITTILIMMVSFALVAQVPEAFNYQAIVRDNAGNPVPDQKVSLQVNIVQGTENGASAYTEVHDIITNEFGLISIQVGNGIEQRGEFSAIDWGIDQYYVQTSLDLEGGRDFEPMGVSRLLSVPYALYAKSSGDNSRYESDYDWWVTGDDIVTGFGGAYPPGNVGIGTLTPGAKLHVYGTGTSSPATPMLFVEHTKGYSSLFRRIINSPGNALFLMQKARGTLESIDAVLEGDQLGQLRMEGYDGYNYISAANIIGFVDGPVSTGIVPGGLRFQTADSSGTLQERMRITSEGFVGIGTNSPQAMLHVSEDVIIGGTVLGNFNFEDGFGNNLLIQNDLTVLGMMYFNHLTVETLQVNQTTDFYGLVTMYNPLIAHSWAQFNSSVDINGKTSIYNDLYVKNNTTIDGYAQINSLNSSSNSTEGALVVAGGVGIGENLNVSGVIKTGNTLLLDGTYVGGSYSIISDLGFGLIDFDGNNLQNIDSLTANVLKALITTNTVGLNATGHTILNTLFVGGISEFDADADFNYNVNVDGNTQIDGTLTVDGATTLKSTLNVQDDADFDKNVNINGSTQIDFDLNVDGLTTLDTTIVDGLFAVNGPTYLYGILDVQDTAVFRDSINVMGNADFDKNVNIDGSLQVDIDLNVDGNTTLNPTWVDGPFTVNGNSDLNGTLDVQDPAIFQSTINVMGNADFEMNVDIDGNTQMDGDLNVDGLTTLDTTTVDGLFTVNGPTDLNGILNVQDTAVFQDSVNVMGNVDFDMNLNVDGNTWIGGTLNVVGATILQFTLNVQDEADFDSDVNIDGNTNINGDLNVNGLTTLDTTTVDGLFTVNGPTDLNGILNVQDTAVFQDSVNVQGNADFDMDVNIDGNLQVGANLNIDGVTTLDQTTIDGPFEVLAPHLSTFGGDVVITSSTPATSSTTGALRVAGGVGIYGDLHVRLTAFMDAASVGNGGLTVSGSSTFFGNLTTQPTSEVNILNPNNPISYVLGGAFIVQGGGRIIKDFYVGGNLYAKGLIVDGPLMVNDNTPSVDSNSGAVVINDGGLGVGENINAYGYIKSGSNNTDSITIDGSANQIRSSSGTLSFHDDNIETTGTIKSGSSIIIDGSNDKITASSGTLDFDNEDLITAGDIILNNSLKLDASGSTDQITSSGGTIDFDDEDLTTDGTVYSANNDVQVLTSAATISMDIENGHHATLTLAHNTTLTLSNLYAGAKGFIAVTQDGTGGWTLTITTAVTAGGTGTVLSSGAGDIDLIPYFYDGTNLFVNIANDFQ